MTRESKTKTESELREVITKMREEEIANFFKMRKLMMEISDHEHRINSLLCQIQKLKQEIAELKREKYPTDDVK